MLTLQTLSDPGKFNPLNRRRCCFLHLNLVRRSSGFALLRPSGDGLVYFCGAVTAALCVRRSFCGRQDFGGDTAPP